MGQTPEFGIAAAQEGIFLSSIEFTPSCETYEQKNYDGDFIGLVKYAQKVEFSFEGEIPKGKTYGFGMGVPITLGNVCPESIWLDGKAPEAMSAIVDTAPVKMERENARTATVNGVIYPFSLTAEEEGA